MYLVLDTATNNVLGEYDTFAEADACRIETVGHNAPLAEYIQVVNIDQLIDERRAARRAAEAQLA